MDKLLESIKALENAELIRAAKKHGTAFNSTHEAAAVLREEFEEAADEVNVFIDHYSAYWTGVKTDDTVLMKRSAMYMQLHAEQCAAEWVQVAAMCAKATKTEGDGCG